MENYEFSGFELNPQPSADGHQPASDQVSYLDFIDGDEYLKMHGYKKTKKAVKKQRKKISKLSSKQKKLKKKVAKLQVDVQKFKKSSYESMIIALVNSDSQTERKRLAKELCQWEG